MVDGAVAAWKVIGDGYAYAVRSSATAEDLPGASFAGQQDTLSEHSWRSGADRCDPSLFRESVYRSRHFVSSENRFGHRGIALSVVVQRMVFPDAAGILFTADPVSGHRGTIAIDAGFGLGEALVSGLVTADLYRIDKTTGAVKEVRVGDKAIAIRALPAGGTFDRTALAVAARRGYSTMRRCASCGIWRGALSRTTTVCPRMWSGVWKAMICFVVQARPITSLYPLPTPTPGRGLRVYFGFTTRKT